MGDAGELTPLFSRPVRQGELAAARSGLALEGEADAQERAAIAALHALVELSDLSFHARLEPYLQDGWRLTGRLSARAVQRCVVTLEAVSAEIEEPFERLWRPEAALGDGGARSADAAAGALAAIEAEAGATPDGALRLNADGLDDAPEIEPTPDPIDPAAVALETFTLALDPYPRASGAAFESLAHGPPGSAPLTDEAARPFSALETLKAQLDAADENEAAPAGEPRAPERRDN
ncbi:MAG: hypothetical protein AAGM38_05965 [Pseudomonadota bacterium]